MAGDQEQDGDKCSDKPKDAPPPKATDPKIIGLPSGYQLSKGGLGKLGLRGDVNKKNLRNKNG